MFITYWSVSKSNQHFDSGISQVQWYIMRKIQCFKCTPTKKRDICTGTLCKTALHFKSDWSREWKNILKASKRDVRSCSLQLQITEILFKWQPDNASPHVMSRHFWTIGSVFLDLKPNLHICFAIFPRCRNYVCVKPRPSSIPGYHKKHAAHSKTGQQHVHPDIRGEGVEEGEHPWIGAIWFSVQYADAQGHEGFGEVDNFLPDISDGQRSHSQVSYLVKGTRRGLQGDGNLYCWKKMQIDAVNIRVQSLRWKQVTPAEMDPTTGLWWKMKLFEASCCFMKFIST